MELVDFHQNEYHSFESPSEVLGFIANNQIIVKIINLV